MITWKEALLQALSRGEAPRAALGLNEVCHQVVTDFKGQPILSVGEAVFLPDSACRKPSAESVVGWGPGEGGRLVVGDGEIAGPLAISSLRLPDTGNSLLVPVCNGFTVRAGWCCECSVQTKSFLQTERLRHKECLAPCPRVALRDLHSLPASLGEAQLHHHLMAKAG